MASSSANVQHTELVQLLQLQRSGLLTPVDFLRMSTEITKSNMERLEEVQSEFASGDRLYWNLKNVTEMLYGIP
eukprot:14925-Prymnesium_polylepis.1